MEKVSGSTPSAKQAFKLNHASGYFQSLGVDVMAFDDIYPEGHQSGVSIIMHGNRVATNGDIRLEQTPGQWQPVPQQGKRELDEAANTITTSLSFPDSSRHLKGFNPMIYPDFEFNYKVIVKGEGTSVTVTVDLDRPIPDKFVGKICFNLELFPGALFGKPWIMDNRSGIFPEQPNGPVLSLPSNYSHTGNFSEPDANADLKLLSGDNKGYNPIIADDLIAEPYAVGRRFTVRPDDPYNRFTIESKGTELKLYDGRMNHNNGWFVISSEVPAGATHNAIQWVITPNVVEHWISPAIVQTSQVGYHPSQSKTAIIELDKRDSKREKPVLFKITETGEKQVLSTEGQEWGQFLRYHYLKFDFTDIREEGLYKVRYGSSESAIFRIASDVYDRGVWQPVLEYFLPVQMCHMRVSEKYRVWHGHCHHDDARMAPVNLNHFDGYVQGPSTLTNYKPGDIVPRLNTGGWHDAGDFDLRVESQSGEFYTLALAYEAFDVYYDATTIDQDQRIVEIHQPDGKNDILQQIEHGVLSVVGAYNALGRLYRGIIESDLRQYVHLGDSASMAPDRWVFTEDNPPRELLTAAHLAAAARALKDFNPTLSNQTLQAACEIFKVTDGTGLARTAKIHAAAELFLTTGEQEYKDFLLSEADFIVESIDKVGWFIARAENAMNDAGFTTKIRDALPALKEQFARQSAETPYGIPYRPHIWGAGWGIQRLGYEYYFLHRAYPDIFDSELIFNALNFVLGCHPGSNNMSFASGVGANSATVGYGLNRADWSYIPGGVISGTALIRPNFPELLVFPYLWQQVEYVMGGGSTHFMFIALAAQQLTNGKK
ncbi:glycoside hydrolase family 9 protein [Paenibacillus sp. PR3]|uniref:Glycoside hydrolase family 9 protein n=1 Tax=Paenibacillus terricola TaxID=2763503 RepID=A0ABR8MY42_9BACL|nr:glycoside hydrolase family 9 protein [Paenibacillus terricola]MBD3919114.1 glycoside hydrolase family 9 protein [Paenibacillus terricola]